MTPDEKEASVFLLANGGIAAVVLLAFRWALYEIFR